MPTIIELSLKAERPLRADTRQLHGLACALFEGEGSVHLGQEKPFTIWPLLASPDDGAPERTLRAAWLPDGRLPASVAACEVLRLGSVACVVTESVHRSVTYAQLASRSPVQVAGLAFRSPVFFAQNGTDTVLPDPRLILGSYRRRWNASLVGQDALMVSDDTFRQVHRAARLVSFELRTEGMDSGYGRGRCGFTGTAAMRLDAAATAATRSVFSALLRFAEYCGTGALTTHGFGATELVTPSFPSATAGAGHQGNG